MMETTLQSDSSRHGDPRRVADVALAAAVQARADAVFIEPAAANEHSYELTFERAGAVLATVTIDTQLGTAVIARLAFLSGLDLAAAHVSRGVLPVRSGSIEADVVITLRPGACLRADLTLVWRQRERSAASPPIGPAPGDVIGQYRVLEFLGEGGMGTVFRVEHAALGRRYALKVLRNKVGQRDPGATQKFLREAKTAARVRHPNIVDVFDFGHVPDGRPYLVMELLEGPSLDNLVLDGGPLPPNEVVVIARQLATALAAVHDRGVIHADVTPSNVLVVGNGKEEGWHVKLVDFGAAELVGEGLRDETPGFAFGTPAYISPEQLRGLAATDRSDQYGLGAVLFHLLAGHPPYQDQDLRELCLKHLYAPIPPVESPFGPLPPRLGDIVTTCLQKTPQVRFPGMRALIVALDEIERVIERRGWRRWLSS